MDIFTTVILGIVEGATEFLPISSTAHLLIVEKLMNISASELFNIGIQLGAIFAVIAYAPKRLMMNRKTQYAIIAAFIPTAILGLLLKDIVEVLHGFIWVSIGALFIGGVIMILIEKFWKPKQKITIDEMTTKKAMTIGALQAIAFIPGVSRSAATIYAGLSQGLTKKEAVQFSFFLGIPTMAAATFLSLIKVRHELTMSALGPVLIGSFVAFVIAWLVIDLFMKWIEKHGFTFFGYYRIILSIVLAIVLMN